MKGNREISPCEIQNPGLCSQETAQGVQKSIIQVPLTKTGFQYLESAIHGVEFRIQDRLGFLHMGLYIIQSG